MIRKIIGWFMRFFVKLYFRVDKLTKRYYVSTKNSNTYFVIERKE